MASQQAIRAEASSPPQRQQSAEGDGEVLPQQQEQQQQRENHSTSADSANTGSNDSGTGHLGTQKPQSKPKQNRPTPSAVARARWKQAGHAIQAVHRFMGVPALLPRADMSDRTQIPDTRLHRIIGWSLGSMFLIILVAYLATLSYRAFHDANEASFDFVTVHALPVVALMAVVLHLAKSFVRASTALYSTPFSHLPIHLQSAFSNIYISTCVDFFVFVWAFDVLWIRDYGRGFDNAWFAQVTPIVIMLVVTSAIMNLFQRNNWAWAAVLHHTFLLTAPVMFLDPALRHRFCQQQGGPQQTECSLAVLRIFGVQLWAESFDLVLGIAFSIYLTGCRSRTLRDSFSAGLVFFALSKLYAFVHSLVLFIVDFESFEPFFQAWYILSLVMLVMCQGFEMYGVLVLLGRLDILEGYLSNQTEADDVQQEGKQSLFSCASIAAKAHESAYRTYVSQVQGYKVPLLISVWDDMIIGAEYATAQRAAAMHEKASAHGNHSPQLRRQEASLSPEASQMSAESQEPPVTHTMEELLAYLNGTTSHEMFDSTTV